MPTVPNISNINTSGYGTSPMAAPSAANLLMAAADMHSSGKLGSNSQPDPANAKKRSHQLKVIK